MPTIHRESGFRVMIHLDDHGPPHVHVRAAEQAARIRIGDENTVPSVMDAGNMRAATLGRAVRIVERQQERFLAEWRRYHGP